MMNVQRFIVLLEIVIESALSIFLLCQLHIFPTNANHRYCKFGRKNVQQAKTPPNLSRRVFRLGMA